MARRSTLAGTFCSCIKKVRKSVVPRRNLTRKGLKVRDREAKESAAIAICVRSVLRKRGRTLKRFRCDAKKPVLETQKPLSVK